MGSYFLSLNESCVFVSLYALWFCCCCCWKLDIWKKKYLHFCRLAPWISSSWRFKFFSGLLEHTSLESCVCAFPPNSPIYTDTFKCLNFSKCLSFAFSQGLRCSIYSSVGNPLPSGNYGSPIAPHFSHAATPSTAFSGFQPVIQTMFPFFSKLQVRLNRNQFLRQPLDK